MRLLKAGEMAQIDRETIETVGIPGIVLMENASRGVAEVVYRYVKGSSVLVVCGKGNNGGDGLAAARHLYNLGYEVTVVLTTQPENLKGDARQNYEIISKLPVPVHVIDTSERLIELYELLKESEIVIDALFGTGLSKPLQGFYADVVDLINRSNRTVVSVDIPSGLSADTGKVIGKHVVADYTVTFAYPKIAHVFPPACESCGKVFVTDISIPEDVPFLLGPERYLLTADEVLFTLPPREIMDHKYTFGHVAVIGGSVGKTGAPSMAAEAVLRTGAGLSTVIVPESLNQIFETKLTEVMSIPIKDDGKGYFGIGELEPVLETVENGKFSAVVIGMGLGNNPDTYEFVREFVKECNLPMVIDADGINALSESPEILKLKEVPTILTPHIGEFSRISKKSKEEILSAPCEVALEFSQHFGVTLVLKSGRTVVATKEGKTYVNVIGNPGMATAGTGDVLSGVVGALLGMGIEEEDAAKFGVFLHSLAGDIAAEELTQESLKACDLIEKLPKAIKKIKELERNPKKSASPFVTELREIVGV